MAGKSKNMSQIKQLLLLKKNGVSNRKAASIIGINKETVNNYMSKVNADELGIDDLLKHPYTRKERFLAIDKHNLMPLPECDFEIVSYADLKIASNCCIYLGRDQHYYTVPYQHISKTAHVAYTRTLVKIYVDGNLVATHKRDYGKGKYSIIEHHLASKSQEYRGLCAKVYIDRADRAVHILGDVVRHIFYTSNMPAETHYKTCEGLLNLQRCSDPIIFQTACETALKLDRCNYRFIRSLVDSKCAGLLSQSPQYAPPEHANIRGKVQFR